MKYDCTYEMRAEIPSLISNVADVSSNIASYTVCNIVSNIAITSLAVIIALTTSYSGRL